MAKAFSDKDKEVIKDKLLKSALEYMQRFGIRKTTVDELAKSVGISKGAFYLFYESKESLFYDAFMLMHDRYQESIFEMLDQFEDELTVDSIVDLSMMGLKKMKPWRDFFASGELDYLLSRLPTETVEHIKQDNDFFDQILVIVRDKVTLREDLDIKIVTASFRAIMLTMLHTETIGENVYNDTIKMLFRGLAMQLIKEE